MPGVWTSLVGDAMIEFTLEDTTRTQTDVESFGPDDTVKSPDTGGIAPVAGKLNLWCCSLGQGLLGYAQFPGGPPETDGVVILNTAFGTTGTRRRSRSTSAAPRSTRSATGSGCATSGAT